MGRMTDECKGMKVKQLAWLVVTFIAGGALACGHAPTQSMQPPVGVFYGDFRLVQADDWVAKQACNYVIPVDQTVCSWGRLTITPDQLAESVRGFDVHAGLASGPVIHRDSVSYAASVRVLDACTVAIDSTGVTPNGRGVLAGDTLHFYGHNAAGDSLSWGYSVDQVTLAKACA